MQMLLNTLDNDIEYAKKLFKFFDAKENQELINEFVVDVMLVMELDKMELDKDQKGKIFNGKNLDEIKVILGKNNPDALTNSDALTKNETLNYDLNDGEHNVLTFDFMPNTRA